MTTATTRTISIDERGVAWIAGTGIKVKEVAIKKVIWGMTPEDMLAAHSHWSLPQIYAALSHYYDHQSEVDEQIERDRQWVATQRAAPPSPFTREELLQRLHRRDRRPSAMVSLYMDENVHGAITRGLRQRGVDVQTCSICTYRMAAFLRSLVDELEERHIPCGHDGPAGEGICWNGWDLLIGYAVWQAIGEPPRLSFEFADSTTRIMPDADGAYHIRWARRSCARISCGRLWHQAQWAEGWRPATVERGAIVFDIERAGPEKEL